MAASDMDPKDLAAKLSACACLDRVAAAKALCHSADGARLAAVALVRAIGDEEEEVREWASAALEDLGEPEAADVAQLVELVDTQNADVAYWAVTLLGRMEARAAAAVGTLAAALQASRPVNVRQRAAWALGRIGSAASVARPQLQAAANDGDPRLARLSTTALEALGE